ncbi:MAG: hypothetical protein ACJ8AI_24500 [Rhodopila sp.]
MVLEEAGQSLSRLLSRATPGHWLKNLNGGRSRTLLWRNVRRLVSALSTIHEHGLVHGALNADVVMTRGADEPDFRLSGFEWSLWFSSPSDETSLPTLATAADRRPEAYSFASDWQALGKLIESVLQQGRAPTTGGVSAEPSDLSLHERLLLRRLTSPLQSERLDAPEVLRSIDDICLEISRAERGRQGSFILLLAAGCGLASAVNEATEGAVAEDDYYEQLRWAQADMFSGTSLLVPEAQEGNCSTHPLGEKHFCINGL